MNVDHYFTIGQQHARQGTPCEDYALSGLLGEGLVFGAVSDGCSGANANTDIGARALAHAFARCVRERTGKAPGTWFDDGFFPALQQAFAQNHFTPTREDYLATLAGFVSTPAATSLYFFGDGAYLLKFKSGLHKIVWFEFEGNAPYYLNYTLAADLDAQYRQDIAAKKEKAVLECWTDFEVDAQGDVVLLEEDSRWLPFEAFQQGHVVQLRPQEQQLVLIAVLSDGITLFTNTEVQTVAHQFSAFKTHTGSFVKRRVMRAMEELAKQGITPRDDVAMSCVYFDEA